MFQISPTMYLNLVAFLKTLPKYYQILAKTYQISPKMYLPNFTGIFKNINKTYNLLTKIYKISTKMYLNLPVFLKTLTKITKFYQNFSKFHLKCT
jgi:hypothetical protein